MNLGFPIETVAVFVVLSITAIAIDLFAHRDDKPLSIKSASLWSLFWIAVSLAFGGYLWWHHGSDAANLFFTGYALEKLLSVDNLFVMMAIFAWFKIPESYRHRVLYWGIIGAIVFRLIFVAIGTGLLTLGPYVEFLFAFIVAYSGWVMLKNRDENETNEDYSHHLAYRWVHKFFPVWPRLVGNHFFLSGKTLEQAKQQHPEIKLPEKSIQSKSTLVATPLFLCLAVIELSDVMFAFDSVPAVIAVSREPLIVYSAMMFAILGLRTMYFVLEALKQYLIYLEKSVIVLLFFIAFKLGLSASNHIWHHGFEISPKASLLIVLIVLTTGVLASIIVPSLQNNNKH